MSSPKFLYSDTTRESLILTPKDGPSGSGTAQDVHSTKESRFTAESAQSGGETDSAWKARSTPTAIHIRIHAYVHTHSDHTCEMVYIIHRAIISLYVVNEGTCVRSTL